MKRIRSRSAAAAFALLAAGALNGCATTEAAPRAEGPRVESLAQVAQGREGARPWRVELVRQDGQLCTAVTIRAKVVGIACPPASAKDRPLNFAVDGTKELVVVHGLVGAQVASLERTDVGDGGPRFVVTQSLGADPAHRYFAYAVVPGRARDLVAKGADGVVLVSNAAKLADAQSLADAPPPPPPGGAAAPPR
ncbi:hypothetical protein [Streptomyces sp. PvR034]|uniref:hypothetical protein n=1 Tax=Streptomyces sp. PvR034 TaxID=3156401 RepID=UPI0033975F33